MCLKAGMEKASNCTLDRANTSVQVWVWDYNSGDVHVQHLRNNPHLQLEPFQRTLQRTLLTRLLIFFWIHWHTPDFSSHIRWIKESAQQCFALNSTGASSVICSGVLMFTYQSNVKVGSLSKWSSFSKGPNYCRGLSVGLWHAEHVLWSWHERNAVWHQLRLLAIIRRQSYGPYATTPLAVSMWMFQPR